MCNISINVSASIWLSLSFTTSRAALHASQWRISGIILLDRENNFRWLWINDMSIIVAIPSSVEPVSRKELRTLSPNGTESVSVYVGGCGHKSAISPDLISKIKIGISLLSVIYRDVESCWSGNVSFRNTRGQKTVLAVIDLDKQTGRQGNISICNR